MKKVALLLTMVFLVLFFLASCAVNHAYKEKITNRTACSAWSADGKGSIFDHNPRPGDTLFLKNAAGDSFKVEVIQVFDLPPDSKSEGVWLEFRNLRPTKGQPDTGLGFVTVRK